MKTDTRVISLLLVMVVAGAGAAPARSDSGDALPPLRVSGRRLVDARGRSVTLKGCNLGNWLLIEPWLLAIDDAHLRDQHEFIATLRSRFGAERAEQLLDTYRANWITTREFRCLKSFGFNVVRVPFDHALLAAENQPFTLRENAFEWLDRAVELAEQAGVYVILDMHGVPGGQSTAMPSGRIGENELWHSPADQEQTAWLWREIARRYHDRSAVIAYDLMNEPWSDYREDVRPMLVSIVDRVYRAIREVDADTLIFAPGSLRGIAFYGKPADRGWRNLGFTEHFYPGLFGQGSPSLETHARFLTYGLAARKRLLERLEAPYFVGEFNVVFDSAAQSALMRRYFDTFAANGWLATMWTVRMVSPQGGVQDNNWYLETNAEPFVLPNPRTASDAEIERAFCRLGDQPMVVDEELRAALTAPQESDLRLAELPPLPAKAPADVIPGWSGTDIATTLAGGQIRHPDGSVTIYGSGSDIWSNHDAFHYVHRPAEDTFARRTWLTSFEAPHSFAKAGWMLRESLEPDAAHIFIHAFPDGRVMLAWRSERGAQMQERTLAISGLPVGLGIEREHGVIRVNYTDADGHWRGKTFTEATSLTRGGLLGWAVLAHDESVLAMATCRSLGDTNEAPPSAANPGVNLLQNASFETVKDAQTHADQPRGWQRWGQWFNREKGWQPRRDGDCVLGYHHWRIESPENSGVYQDVSGLRPGDRCSFRVYANRDPIPAGQQGPDSVELRIESPLGGRLLNVASRTYRAADLAEGTGWSLLEVTGTIPSGKARVLIVVNPSRAGPRGAALKFDEASFHVARSVKSVGIVDQSLSELEEER